MSCNEAFFERIVAITADAIVTANESRRIVHANRSAELLFGYPADEILEQSLDLLLPQFYHQQQYAPAQSASASYAHRYNEPTHSDSLSGDWREIPGRRKDGTEFPAEASMLTFENPVAERYVTVVVRDITDRKLLEQQQRFLSEVSIMLGSSLEYEDMLHLIVRVSVPSIADMVVLDIVSESGELRRLSYAAPDGALAAVAEALRERFVPSWESPSIVIDVLHSGREQLITELTSDWLESRCETLDEVALLRCSGITSLLTLPLIGRGRTLGVISLYTCDPRLRYGQTDVMLGRALASRAALALDNSRLYRDALRATRTRDDILSIVSHDLRNPLSAIFMSTTTLQHQFDAASEEYELLSIINDSAKWMSRLIRDLLDSAMIEAGKLSISLQSEFISPILEQIERVFAPMAMDKGISFDIYIDDDIPCVLCDKERILQAIANLVNNAIKFTAPGASVTLRARWHIATVVFEVQDTGCGISQEDLPHVFERYWSRMGCREEKGSGLGLGITRGIVEAHGGRVEVKSTIGIGSTFAIILPLVPLERASVIPHWDQNLDTLNG